MMHVIVIPDVLCVKNTLLIFNYAITQFELIPQIMNFSFFHCIRAVTTVAVRCTVAAWSCCTRGRCYWWIRATCEHGFLFLFAEIVLRSICGVIHCKGVRASMRRVVAAALLFIMIVVMSRLSIGRRERNRWSICFTFNCGVFKCLLLLYHSGSLWTLLIWLAIVSLMYIIIELLVIIFHDTGTTCNWIFFFFKHSDLLSCFRTRCF